MTMLLIGKLGDKNFWYHAKQFADFDENTEIIRVGGLFELEGLERCKVHYSQNLGMALLLAVKFMPRHELVVCFGFRWVGVLIGALNIFYQKRLIVTSVGTDVYTLKKYKTYATLLPIHKFIFPGKVNRERAGFGFCNDVFLLPWIMPYILPQGQYEDGLNWLMINRFDANKNPEYGIKLFLNSKESLTANLHLYGAGKELVFLKKKYKDFNNIVFEGFVDAKEIEFKKFSVYLQTSKSEGLSLALLEALWSGLKPFVTRAGDEEILLGKDFNGYLSGDLKSDIEKIEKALCNTREEISEELKIIKSKYEQYEFSQRRELKRLLYPTK